jgi:hypothetical protein
MWYYAAIYRQGDKEQINPVMDVLNQSDTRLRQVFDQLILFKPL